MEIRKYSHDDLAEIIRLFQNTVRLINIQDYSQEQIEVWAPDFIDMEQWDKSLSKHYTFVAVQDSIIIGFGDIDESGYLDRLYVHHYYQRQGVATLICGKLESMVCPDTTIRTNSSITAKPFFVKRGYRVVKEQLLERCGILLKNYVMELPGSLRSSLWHCSSN